MYDQEIQFPVRDFTLVDCAFYALTLSLIGREALVVTTNVNINFVKTITARSTLLYQNAEIWKATLCRGCFGL